MMRTARAEAMPVADPVGATGLLRVGTFDVAPGMFVADLDRPWLDTPFLIQGFVIAGPGEVAALQRTCRHVYVDAARSSPEGAAQLEQLVGLGKAIQESGDPSVRSADAARLLASVHDSEARAGNRLDGTRVEARTPTRLMASAAPAAGPAPRAAAPVPSPPRDDLHISAQTRERFRSLALAGARASAAPPRSAPGDGLGSRLMAWLRELFPSGGDADATRADPSRAAIHAELPASIVPRRYETVTSLQEELPRARAAFDLGERVVGHLLEDIRDGRVQGIDDVREVADALVESMLDNPEALMLVSRLRRESAEAYTHSIRVALYLVALGRQIGFPQDELVHLGTIGMLADVGKLRLPQTLLEKPGTLTPAEFAMVREHVRLGIESLSRGGPLPRQVELGIAEHHERLDGTGYPRALKGTEISLYGRMAAIADCFTALTTPRGYASTRSPQEALMALYQWSGTSFHEPMVEQFVQALSAFPVGSLVELSNGEVAIVVAHNPARRLEPRVLVMTAPDKTRLPEPIGRNLLAQDETREGRLRIRKGLPIGAYGLDLRDYFLENPSIADGLLG
jgi:HD-GYP domain-containing protein (c-di-GMP phosphodiesterase class II)